jgi:hypothetical protein
MIEDTGMVGVSEEAIANILNDPEIWTALKAIPADQRAELWRDLGVPDDKIAEMQVEIEQH